MAEYIVNARPSDLFGIRITGKVVRCYECERRNTIKCPLHECGNSENDTYDNWYCGDGERKEE